MSFKHTQSLVLLSECPILSAFIALLCMCHIKELAANFLIMYTFKNKLTPCLSHCWGDYNVYVRFYSVNVEVKSVICTIWFKTYYLQKTYSYHLLNETVSLGDTAISLHRPVPSKKSFVRSSNFGKGGAILGKLLPQIPQPSMRNSSFWGISWQVFN